MKIYNTQKCLRTADAPIRSRIKFDCLISLQMIGISFHVGSGCRTVSIFAKAIHEAHKLFDVAKNIGFKFNLLDIGGGFPGEKNTSIDEVCSQSRFLCIAKCIRIFFSPFFQVASIVNNSLDLYFPSSDVSVIAEPGRFYVSSAFTLACRVHSKREIRNAKNGKTERIMYFMNDGIFGSINCHIFDDIVRPIILKPSNGELFKSIIWGATMAPIDQVKPSLTDCLKTRKLK